MNNFGIALKKFFTNKNTVTIIGIIVILILLYIGYDKTVKKSVDPINVPVASKRIVSQQEITNDYIAYKKVSKVVVGSNVLTSSYDIIGKYTNVGVTIPEGSMFYKEWLVSKDDVPGKWIENVDFENGEEAYYFSTDTIKTLGNSVLPDSYIDIYMKANDENGHMMYGKLLENIHVLVDNDGTGKNVFDDSAALRNPSYLGFALSHEFYILLSKAQRFSGIDLIIAPQGFSPQATDENTILVGSETLRDYIDANTVMLEDEHVEERTIKIEGENMDNSITNSENYDNVLTNEENNNMVNE